MNLSAHPRISRNPAIMMGKPVIAGTRVTVEAVLEQFAAGANLPWVLEAYPQLNEEDVRAAMTFTRDIVGGFRF